MKIVFLNPPWLYKLPEADRASNILGLLYLASVARSHGHEVQVIDALRAHLDQAMPFDYGGRRFYRMGLTFDEIIHRIPEDVDVIAIGAPFTNLFRVIEDLTAALKRGRPRARLILGGGLPSAVPDLCQRLPNVDALVIGEGEVTLLNYVEGGAEPRGPAGPHVFQGEKVLDLDTLPIPDRSLTDISRYFDLGPRNRTRLRTAAMITSRGCPYSCHFCSIQPTLGRGYRSRSPESVLEEIDILASHHRVQIIDFEDDNMLHDSNRAIEILTRLARYRHSHRSLLGCSFPNGVRIDKLSDEMLRALVEAGTHKLVLPVEHGHLDIRRKMLKPISDEVIYSAAERASRLGLPIEVFVMIGYPDESDDIFRDGAKFMASIGELPGVELNYLFPQPYPGTKLQREVRDRNYDVDAADETLFCGIGPVITTPLFDHAKLDSRRQAFDRISQRWRHLKHTRTLPANLAVSIVPKGERRDDDRIVATDETLTSLPGHHHNGSNLTRCAIRGTALADTEMQLSVFVGCDFSGADLSSWTASHSTFNNCRFTNAVLTNATLERCQLQGADMSGLDLRGANLTHCDLTGALLVGANLSGAVLHGARLVDADLTGANLTGANFGKSIVARSRMTRACLDRLVARDALFEEVCLTGAKGSAMALDRARLIGCRLDSAELAAHMHRTLIDGCTGGVIVSLGDSDDYLQLWDGQGLHWVSPNSAAGHSLKYAPPPGPLRSPDQV